MTQTALAAPVHTVTFEAFRQLMQKWVARVVPRHVRHGPFQSREDLLAEADLALLQVYRNPKYGGVSVSVLGRIGTRAVVNKMLNVYDRAGSGRMRGWEAPFGRLETAGRAGRKRVVRVVRPRIEYIDLDHAQLQSSSGRDRAGFLRIRDVPDASSSPHQRAEARITVDRVVKSDPCARAILAEALDPSDKTRRALRRSTPVSIAIARSLGMKEADVAQAFKSLRRMIREELSGYSAVSARNDRRVAPKGKTMDSDILRPEAPDDTSLVTDGTLRLITALEQEPSKKLASKAGGVKSKKKKSAARGVGNAAGKYKVGQEVKYKGGSRCSWLVTGCTLVVKGIAKSRGRVYTRLFAVNAKKPCVLAEEFIVAK